MRSSQVYATVCHIVAGVICYLPKKGSDGSKQIAGKRCFGIGHRIPHLFCGSSSLSDDCLSVRAAPVLPRLCLPLHIRAEATTGLEILASVARWLRAYFSATCKLYCAT
jgi:hypothetical protein